MWIAPPGREFNGEAGADERPVRATAVAGAVAAARPVAPPLATRRRSPPSCREDQDQRPPRSSTAPHHGLRMSCPTRVLRGPVIPIQITFMWGLPVPRPPCPPAPYMRGDWRVYIGRHGEASGHQHTPSDLRSVKDISISLTVTEMKHSGSLCLLLILALCSSLVQAQVLFQVVRRRREYHRVCYYQKILVRILFLNFHG